MGLKCGFCAGYVHLRVVLDTNCNIISLDTCIAMKGICSVVIMFLGHIFDVRVMRLRQVGALTIRVSCLTIGNLKSNRYALGLESSVFREY